MIRAGFGVPSPGVFLFNPGMEAPLEFLISSLHPCGNTGTYVDAPLHRIRGATDLAGLQLDCLAHLPVQAIDVTHLRAVPTRGFLHAVPLAWQGSGAPMLVEQSAGRVAPVLAEPRTVLYPPR